MKSSSKKVENEERSREGVDELLVYEKNPLIKKKRKKVKSGSEGDFTAAPPLLFGANIGSKEDVPRKAMKEHGAAAHDGLLDEALVRSSVKGHHLDNPAR